MATVVQFRQSSQATIDATGLTHPFPSPVTTGNAVIVAVANAAGTSTIGASDATNGAYTLAVDRQAASRTVAILELRNVTGGWTSLTVTSSVSGTGRWVAVEVSGLDTSASPQTGNKNNPTTTAAECSTTVLSGDGFAICALMAGSAGTWTPGPGYTAGSPTTSNSRIFQYLAASGIADDGPITTPSTTSDGCMALFADVSVPDILVPPSTNRIARQSGRRRHPAVSSPGGFF